MTQIYHIYILKINFSDNTIGFYVGETADISQRLADHLHQNSKSTHLIHCYSENSKNCYSKKCKRKDCKEQHKFIRDISVEMIYTINLDEILKQFNKKRRENQESPIGDFDQRQKKSIADQLENIVVCTLFKKPIDNHSYSLGLNYSVINNVNHEKSTFFYAGGFLAQCWQRDCQQSEISKHIQKKFKNGKWLISLRSEYYYLTVENCLKVEKCEKLKKLQNVSLDSIRYCKNETEKKE